MNTDINNKPHNKQKKINLKKRDGSKSKKNNNTIDTDLLIEILPDVLENVLLNSKTIFEHVEAFFNFIVNFIKEIN